MEGGIAIFTLTIGICSCLQQTLYLFNVPSKNSNLKKTITRMPLLIG